MKAHFIFFVENQEASARFYGALLQLDPVLDVPGMTEFSLSKESVLGLMPRIGIQRIANAQFRYFSPGGSPNAELYLEVSAAKEYHERALRLGAREISPLQQRSWGAKVSYVQDVDGNLIAFAEA